MFTYVNHVRIRSGNQPALSNEGKFVLLNTLYKETTGDVQILR